MKKIIYSNIILIAVFFMVPWFYFQNRRAVGDFSISANTFIYFFSIAALVLLFINARFAIKMRNTERKVAIFFIIPPAFILLYFIQGYFAFSGFTGF